LNYCVVRPFSERSEEGTALLERKNKPHSDVRKEEVKQLANEEVRNERVGLSLRGVLLEKGKRDV
jgi:hypothetical protein